MLKKAAAVGVDRDFQAGNSMWTAKLAWRAENDARELDRQHGRIRHRMQLLHRPSASALTKNFDTRPTVVKSATNGISATLYGNDQIGWQTNPCVVVRGVEYWSTSIRMCHFPRNDCSPRRSHGTQPRKRVIDDRRQASGAR